MVPKRRFALALPLLVVACHGGRTRIRPEVARQVITVRAETPQRGLADQTVIEVRRFRTRWAPGVRVDSTWPTRYTLVVGVFPMPAGEGSLVSGRLLNNENSVIVEASGLRAGSRDGWIRVIPELVHRLLSAQPDTTRRR